MKNVFSGKHIIVTGGASGIGASLVEKFVKFGATVVVIGRSEQYDGPARYERADMSKLEDARKVFDRITKDLGTIDYVINSAGIFMGGEIRDTPFDEWHKVIDNNIYAVAHGAQLAYLQMITQKGGHIVNIASTAGLIPVPAMGIYGSTKYALVGMSHAMRNEAAELGVKVSVACPTVVNTPLYDTATYNNLEVQPLLRRRGTLQTPDVAADRIIRGIVRNQATIHTSLMTRVIWVAYRLSPALYDLAARRIMRRYRGDFRTHN